MMVRMRLLMVRIFRSALPFWEDVWGARKTEVHAVRGAKIVKLIIGILTTVVTLELFYFSVELGLDKGVKFGEHGKDIRFVGNWISPQKICEIIQK